MKNSIFIFLLLLFAASACKTARLAKGSNLKPKSEKTLMKHLLENQVNADWLGARAKVTYEDESGKETFTANIRLRKDSVIWMNFKKFSIEGARVLVTPDSIYVLDRLNNEYAIKPFEFAQKEYSLPVGFSGLQAMLLGNPFFISEKSEASADSSHYVLTQKTDHLQAQYFLDAAKMLLRQFLVEDFRQRRTASMESGDYQILEDKQNFSYFRRLHLTSPDLGNVSIEIEFSKVEINVPQSMEFQIPDRYERVD